jgi:hypothetical protein
MAAFARLAENPPSAEALPSWPRAVRIAVDYALRVAIANVADMNERAFELLGTIRDTSATLLRRQIAVPALPTPTMVLLQQAARGEPVPDSELHDVLEAAERLHDRLGFSVLTSTN